jgi:hypothetical protein
MFYHDIDFNGANYKYIYLYNIEHNKTTTLFFDELNAPKIKAHWATIKDIVQKNEPVFFSFYKNYRDWGLTDEAIECFYDYREWKRIHAPNFKSWFLDSLAEQSCGYGVKWQKTLESSSYILVIFGIYYCFRKILSKLGKDKIEIKEELIKSMVFSAFILLQIPSDWYPFDNKELQNVIKSYIISATIERLTGLMLLLLLIGVLRPNLG